MAEEIKLSQSKETMLSQNNCPVMAEETMLSQNNCPVTMAEETKLSQNNCPVTMAEEAKLSQNNCPVTMAEEAKAKGNSAYSAGNFQEAVRHFTEAISLSPSPNHLLYSNRSAAYASLSLFPLALTDAQTTVDLQPNWSKSYSRLGFAYLGLNKLTEAVSSYKKGLELDPNNQFLKSGLKRFQQKIMLLNTRVGDLYPLEEPISVLKLPYKHQYPLILASCNGVVLTQNDYTRAEFGIIMPCEYKADAVLQNPFTKTVHKIPFMEFIWPGPDNHYSKPEKYVFGLWYDDVQDDYKVFRNCQSCGNTSYSQVNIYSSKTRSHKQIKPFPYYVREGVAETVFCGGALHWVVTPTRQDKSQLVAAFDVGSEEYRLVEQPREYSASEFKLSVHQLGGCLSVVCRSLSDGHVDLWVMKEYGKAESWFKLISIRADDLGVESVGCVKPVVYSDCGKRVLLERDRRSLLWYDVENKSVEFVGMGDRLLQEPFQAFVHMESLVKLRCHGDSGDMRGPEDTPMLGTLRHFFPAGFRGY